MQSADHFSDNGDQSAVLALQVALSGVFSVVALLAWAVTGAGYFWPMWVWLAVGAPLAMHLALRQALEVEPGQPRGLAVHAATTGVVCGVLIVLWGMTGRGAFWPVWPLLALGTVLSVHVVIFRQWDELPGAREQELADRVDVLTRTRRGALDVQAAELRRIERDLHDGAQARLVALSMQLGRAEARLEDRPEVAALLRAARSEASAAIAELRDLARGIAPPVLADRGLAAAIEALGRRAAIPVEVDVQLSRRPLPVVETAAYFVVAEALTNVAKHAGGASARVRVAEESGRLVIVISDDGPGGADTDGGGLTGLRHRVEALDGALEVSSPSGEGTTIRAELPCES
ncbi:histidine kinase [Baekduia soli]|uniref:histidine kinase n=2 Tax=Baekduia soli TaxID=496014 RepID=A0A5B8UCD8_9ACTN|nr:histidine kinase [Baekduia soli]